MITLHADDHLVVLVVLVIAPANNHLRDASTTSGSVSLPVTERCQGFVRLATACTEKQLDTLLVPQIQSKLQRYGSLVRCAPLLRRPQPPRDTDADSGRDAGNGCDARRERTDMASENVDCPADARATGIELPMAATAKICH